MRGRKRFSLQTGRLNRSSHTHTLSLLPLGIDDSTGALSGLLPMGGSFAWPASGAALSGLFMEK